MPLHPQDMPNHYHPTPSSAPGAMTAQPTSSSSSASQKATLDPEDKRTHIEAYSDFNPPFPDESEYKPLQQRFGLPNRGEASQQPKSDHEDRDGAKDVPSVNNASNVVGDSATKPRPKRRLAIVLAADGSIENITFVDDVVVADEK